jgi:hypothetical protein
MAGDGFVGCGTAKGRQIAGKQPHDIIGQLSPHSRACSSMGRLSGSIGRIRRKTLTNYELSPIAAVAATTSACSIKSIDNKSIQMRRCALRL